MAIELEQLQLRLEAQMTKFEKDMNRARGLAQKNFKAIEDRGTAMERSLANTGASIRSSIVPALAAIGAGLSVSSIVAYGDAWARIKNQLTVSGVALSEQADLLSNLYEIAQRNGAPLEQLSELYAKASAAAAELGADQQQLLQFTSGVAAALRINGGSAASAAGALQQLSQALGSGTIRAEEFNSILEGARPIAQAAARGFEGAGGSVSKLRQLVTDGKVSSSEFFAAFLSGVQRLETQAGSATLTVSQSFTQLENAFTKFVGELNATPVLAGGLTLVADNLATIVKFAATAGAALIAARLGPTIVATGAAAAAAASSYAFAGLGLVAYTGNALSASVATRTLTAALLANPFTAVLTAVTAATTAYFLFADATQDAEDRTRDLVDELIKVQNASDENAVASQILADKKRDLNAAIEILIELQKEEADRSRDVSAARAQEAVETTRLAIAERRLALEKAKAVASSARTEFMRGSGGGVIGGLGDITRGVNAEKQVTDLTTQINALETAAKNAEGEVAKLLKDGLDKLDVEAPPVPSRPDVVRRRSSGGGSSGSRANPIAGLLDSGRAQIASLGVEATALGMAAGEADKYRFAQELLARAKQQDIAITPALAASLRDLVDQYGRANSELERQKAIQASDDFIGQAGARRDALAVELEAMKRGGEESERFRFEQELLTQAKERDIQLTPDVVGSIGQIAAQYARVRTEIEALKRSQDDAADGMRTLKDVGLSVFDDLIYGGKSASEIMRGLLKQLASSALQNLVNGTNGGLAGGLDKVLGGLDIFGRASGGPVNAGQPYRVGESGPEYFVPRVPGRIQRGGGSGGVTAITVDLRGTTGDKALDQKLKASAAASYQAAYGAVRRDFGSMLSDHQARR